MNKIEVAVLSEHGDPGGMMMFLAKLTQRGHSIKDMADLHALYSACSCPKSRAIENMVKLPHGTIKRFCPITIAIVGASRRFLAQARTNQVGFNYVSASLQYSNYSGKSDFVVPYALLDNEVSKEKYLASCQASMEAYEYIAADADNDTAGYAAPQGLRNILIMQANHQSWDYFIRLRGCNRNTVETQYITMLIWEALLNTLDGEAFFGNSGADCMSGACREGKMCCGVSLRPYINKAKEEGKTVPRCIIEDKWPLLREV